jgi:hypothetical protein
MLAGMNASIFHREFKPRPYWWDHHEPTALPEIGLPKQVALPSSGPVMLTNAAPDRTASCSAPPAGLRGPPAMAAWCRAASWASVMARGVTDAEAAPHPTDAADATHVDNLITRANINCG